MNNDVLPTMLKQKLFGRWCGILFTAALWVIYIETAVHVSHLLE